MRPRIPIRKALEDPNILGCELSDDSWLPMRSLAIAALGEELTEEERQHFSTLTKRDREPLQRVKRFVCIAGRRSGKSRMSAALCIYLACLCDHSANLSVGEKGIVLCIAQNTDQAKVVFNYVVGIINSQPILRKEVLSITRETITFKNKIEIQVRPASFRGLRGMTLVAAICDEIAFWYQEENNSANSDVEIINALTPALITTRGMLISISSPYARRGIVWKMYSKHFGPEGDPLTLVAQGASTDFNSTIDQSEIDAALEEDYAVAQSEWLGLFRTDLEQYVSAEAVKSCVTPGIYENAPEFNNIYCAFVDAATGAGQDDFALAIGHLEGEQIIVDCIRAHTPKFSPEAVVAELSELLHLYGVTKVYGDNFASGFVRELFSKNAIVYEPVKENASQLYTGLLGVINSQRIQLPDNQKLISQLVNLERRTGFAGKDRISHPIGLHDDVANVVAGLSSIVTKERANDLTLRMWGIKPTLWEERMQRERMAKEAEERSKERQ